MSESKSVEEEAREIAHIARDLLSGGTTWADRNGKEKELTPEEILIVAPHNSQVPLLDEALDQAGITGMRVGTVDKFQGQEMADF